MKIVEAKVSVFEITRGLFVDIFISVFLSTYDSTVVGTIRMRQKRRTCFLVILVPRIRNYECLGP